MNNEVELVGDRPEMVQRMLKFLYKSDYNDHTNGLHPLEVNASMYEIANKYSVHHLKDLAIHKFLIALNGPLLSEDLFPHFLKAVKIIYSPSASSDRGLRDHLIDVFKANRVGLRGHEEFMALTESGLGNNSFAGDVIRAVM